MARKAMGRHAGEAGLPSPEERLGEQVEFWRGLIEDWEQKHGEPAHPRAYEALRHAEKKLEMYRNGTHAMYAARAQNTRMFH